MRWSVNLLPSETGENYIKRQSFKASGNGPKRHITNEEIYIQENLLKFSNNRGNKWYLSQDLE